MLILPRVISYTIYSIPAIGNNIVLLTYRSIITCASQYMITMWLIWPIVYNYTRIHVHNSLHINLSDSVSITCDIQCIFRLASYVNNMYAIYVVSYITKSAILKCVQ